MARLQIPVGRCVLGEGGSGGADRDRPRRPGVDAGETRSIRLSPLKAARQFLWRDAGEYKKAAAAFKPDALHCLELGVVDEIVAEPKGGAHKDVDEAARLLKQAILGALESLKGTSGEELRRTRRAKFRRMGVFAKPSA